MPLKLNPTCFNKGGLGKRQIKILLSWGLVFVLFAGFFLMFPKISRADDLADANAAKRTDLEKQLQQLEQEAADLDKTLQQVQGESLTLANEITTLNTEIKRREVEIKRLTLVIKQTDLEIQNKTATINVLSGKIEKSKEALAAGLFMLYASDQNSPLIVLLQNKNISDFFNSVNNMQKVEGGIHDNLVSFKENRDATTQQRNDLVDYEAEQNDLKSLQDMERKFLAQKKKEKDDLLRLTKGKEVLFQQLLASKKKDIVSLQTQLFYLEKTGITANDALNYANLAAQRAGIRTAFLLALLEVETGKQFEDGVITAGTHLGNGNWRDDLYNCYIRLGRRSVAESEKNAFFQITSKLNLDPDAMPVSRRYANNAGCGGAMGPAQFLPTTWLRFEDQVAQLTGHNPPNPWNIEDGFTAAAAFLASAGADSKTEIGETQAARIYISGKSTCSQRSSGARYICLSYSKKVMELADEIEASIKISELSSRVLAFPQSVNDGVQISFQN